MNNAQSILQNIIDDFSPQKFTRFFREISGGNFRQADNYISSYNNDDFSNGALLGQIEMPDDKIICFTIEENTLDDMELELNPEFLGIIFERLVNKEDGAIYTPRIEVYFMCRISLVKWFQKNSKVNKKKLYHLFFYKGTESSKFDALTDDEKNEILGLLQSLTVCDPAAGSGAFLVGMLQVLDEIICLLRSENSSSSFERKKEIISRSLYGVEVKEWAVWINQLRLWLTFFIGNMHELIVLYLILPLKDSPSKTTQAPQSSSLQTSFVPESLFCFLMKSSNTIAGFTFTLTCLSFNIKDKSFSIIILNKLSFIKNQLYKNY